MVRPNDGRRPGDGSEPAGVLHIERVINFDLPDTHELFAQRVGRMERSGRAIMLNGFCGFGRRRPARVRQQGPRRRRVLRCSTRL